MTSHTAKHIDALILAIMCTLLLLESIDKGNLVIAALSFIVFAIATPMAYYYFERRKYQGLTEKEMLEIYKTTERELKRKNNN